MHDQGGRILRPRLGIGQHQIDNRLGFRIHAARKIEPGKIDPRRRALVAFRCRDSGDKFIPSSDEIFRLIFVPVGGVENRPYRDRRAFRADLGR